MLLSLLLSNRTVFTTGALKMTNTDYITWKKMSFLANGLSVLPLMSSRKSQFTFLILTPLAHISVSHSEKEKQTWAS